MTCEREGSVTPFLGRNQQKIFGLKVVVQGGGRKINVEDRSE